MSDDEENDAFDEEEDEDGVMMDYNPPEKWEGRAKQHKTKIHYTANECDLWNKGDKTHSSSTNRPVEFGKATYRALEKACRRYLPPGQSKQEVRKRNKIALLHQQPRRRLIRRAGDGDAGGGGENAGNIVAATAWPSKMISWKQHSWKQQQQQQQQQQRYHRQSHLQKHWSQATIPRLSLKKTGGNGKDDKVSKLDMKHSHHKKHQTKKKQQRGKTSSVVSSDDDDDNRDDDDDEVKIMDRKQRQKRSSRDDDDDEVKIMDRKQRQKRSSYINEYAYLHRVKVKAPAAEERAEIQREVKKKDPTFFRLTNVTDKVPEANENFVAAQDQWSRLDELSTDFKQIRRNVDADETQLVKLKELSSKNRDVYIFRNLHPPHQIDYFAIYCKAKKKSQDDSEDKSQDSEDDSQESLQESDFWTELKILYYLKHAGFCGYTACIEAYDSKRRVLLVGYSPSYVPLKSFEADKPYANPIRKSRGLQILELFKAREKQHARDQKVAPEIPTKRLLEQKNSWNSTTTRFDRSVFLLSLLEIIGYMSIYGVSNNSIRPRDLLINVVTTKAKLMNFSKARKFPDLNPLEPRFIRNQYHDYDDHKKTSVSASASASASNDQNSQNIVLTKFQEFVQNDMWSVIETYTLLTFGQRYDDWESGQGTTKNSRAVTAVNALSNEIKQLTGLSLDEFRNGHFFFQSTEEGSCVLYVLHSQEPLHLKSRRALSYMFKVNVTQELNTAILERDVFEKKVSQQQEKIDGFSNRKNPDTKLEIKKIAEEIHLKEKNFRVNHERIQKAEWKHLNSASEQEIKDIFEKPNQPAQPPLSKTLINWSKLAEDVNKFELGDQDASIMPSPIQRPAEPHRPVMNQDVPDAKAFLPARIPVSNVSLAREEGDPDVNLVDVDVSVSPLPPQQQTQQQLDLQHLQREQEQHLQQLHLQQQQQQHLPLHLQPEQQQQEQQEEYLGLEHNARLDLLSGHPNDASVTASPNISAVGDLQLQAELQQYQPNFLRPLPADPLAGPSDDTHISPLNIS